MPSVDLCAARQVGLQHIRKPLPTRLPFAGNRSAILARCPAAVARRRETTSLALMGSLNLRDGRDCRAELRRDPLDGRDRTGRSPWRTSRSTTPSWAACRTDGSPAPSSPFRSIPRRRSETIAARSRFRPHPSPRSHSPSRPRPRRCRSRAPSPPSRLAPSLSAFGDGEAGSRNSAQPSSPRSVPPRATASRRLGARTPPVAVRSIHPACPTLAMPPCAALGAVTIGL